MAVFDVMQETLVADDLVSIVGFGKFSVKKRAARIGRDPLTGEKIQISARTCACH